VTPKGICFRRNTWYDALIDVISYTVLEKLLF